MPIWSSICVAFILGAVFGIVITVVMLKDDSNK